MGTYEDETIGFWLNKPVSEIVAACASLHAWRRQALAESEMNLVFGARLGLSSRLKGRGIEVGAGARPFPVPDHLQVAYGDIRDEPALAAYFGVDAVSGGDTFIDAQTFAGIPASSADFIISAHVIEHLLDPIGAILAAARVLKRGGQMILVAPERTKTFDQLRPDTTLDHLIADALDGGAGTRLDAYREHVRFVHPFLTGEAIPDKDVDAHAERLLSAGMDIHVHAWGLDALTELVEHCCRITTLSVECALSVGNENAFVLRKRG
ncbi:SAM-dependent methyltransferase [Brevundimonas vesicularis]|uniref:SAM-dependent methyltransferase n=1 Tax=Brevundimonas vesicularis TaxID=41276 RepID=A0A7W9FWV0_BREVE|nr:methyltransferase domain-containing protein [Brevundimonas vesicularis]MBB5772974.1 SAM-dependent methyltransferase [Brevundimonas vesicularis]